MQYRKRSRRKYKLLVLIYALLVLTYFVAVDASTDKGYRRPAMNQGFFNPQLHRRK